MTLDVVREEFFAGFKIREAEEQDNKGKKKGNEKRGVIWRAIAENGLTVSIDNHGHGI